MGLPPTGGIVVVEPHADDAFLSCGGLIETWVKRGDLVTIMTVYSGTRKRAEDAKAYARAVGAQWVGLGFEEKGNARENGAAPCSLTEEQAKFLSSSITLLPLGIGGHPEHQEVRDTFSKAYGGNKTFYYVDQPYASKLKNQDELGKRLQGTTVMYIYRPPARKYRHVPLFKDQAKFFHFNPAQELELKGFELVVY